MAKFFKIHTGKKPIGDEEDTEDVSQAPAVNTDDMDKDSDESSEKESSEGCIDKEELKKALKEVDMERSLKYSVEGRNIEELQMMIKMCNSRIKELEKNPSSSNEKNNSLVPSRY